MNIPFLTGKSIYLRPVLEEDLGERYLTWLNDPEVNAYSSRRAFPSTESDMRRFLENAREREWILLAIVVKEGDQHIGNILLGPIDWVDRAGEISVMIGDTEAWGKGYATEAISLLTEHAFTNLDLHRVFSGTINPAYRKIVCDKLGWVQEAEFKKAMWNDGKYVDVWVMSRLNE